MSRTGQTQRAASTIQSPVSWTFSRLSGKWILLVLRSCSKGIWLDFVAIVAIHQYIEVGSWGFALAHDTVWADLAANNLCPAQELDFTSEMDESSSSSSSQSEGDANSYFCRSCRAKNSSASDDSSEKEASTEAQTTGQDWVFVWSKLLFRSSRETFYMFTSEKSNRNENQFRFQTRTVVLIEWLIE